MNNKIPSLFTEGETDVRSSIVPSNVNVDNIMQVFYLQSKLKLLSHVALSGVALNSFFSLR